MTLQRVITKLTMTCWEEPSGYFVQVDVRLCESSLGGGTMRTETERYESLSEYECRDVIEAISLGGLPGAEHGAQMAMFVLE